MLVLWESRRSSTARKNVRRRNCSATKNLPADLKNARTMGTHVACDDPRKCAKRKLLRNKNLPTDLKNARTMVLMSLVDDLRKRSKRKLLCNQKFVNRSQKRSYYRNHVAR
ncbi:hypothetical protein PanWU01x14_304340 [Parasponia andersonii]|uniref:Uncharacterized protein n=1 Tax=Parasponia andersonii TaxID=3476 RepID=A0A2P5ASM1_PARAD|nr:hypothetical protein PanWU01x14_304340 [Parasponia andersonii]